MNSTHTAYELDIVKPTRAEAIAASARVQASRPPMGDLRRRTTTGFIALFMYKNRNARFSADSILNLCAGLTKVDLRRAIARLLDREVIVEAGHCNMPYIEAFGAGRNRIFQWAGNYGYPFASVEAEDTLRIPGPSLLPTSNKVISPGPEVFTTSGIKTVVPAFFAALQALSVDTIKGVSGRISILEQELAREKISLNSMTELYLQKQLPVFSTVETRV